MRDADSGHGAKGTANPGERHPHGAHPCRARGAHPRAARPRGLHLRARSARPYDSPRAPDDLHPHLRGERALLAVWAWAVPATRVVVDVTPAPADRLALSFGVRDRGAEEGSPRVTFTVSLGGARGEPDTVLLRRTLDPARVEGDRGWQEV